jgi:ankyrin repeat protein
MITSLLVTEKHMTEKILRKIAETHAITSFEAAMSTDDAMLVELIIECNGDEIGPDAFITACRCECTNIVRLFLESAFRVDSEALGVGFQVACALNNIEIVRLILASAIGSEALNVGFRAACNNGCTEIVRLLLDLPLERGVDPASFNNAAIRMASENGHTENVSLLLDVGRGVNPAACFKCRISNGV